VKVILLHRLTRYVQLKLQLSLQRWDETKKKKKKKT